MTIEQYAFFATICAMVFGIGWFIERINHKEYRLINTLPDKIITIKIYEEKKGCQ